MWVFASFLFRMRTYSVTWNHILSNVCAWNIRVYVDGIHQLVWEHILSRETTFYQMCVFETYVCMYIRVLTHLYICDGIHRLAWENTFCHKRTHSVTWEHTLSHENTFCHVRTHSVKWEHILPHENTLYHMRTHSIIRGPHSIKCVSVWHENMFCQIRIWFIRWEHLLSDQETFCCMSVCEAVSTTQTHGHTDT